MKNPFKPTFGSIPDTLAGRQQIMTEVLDGLENAPGDPNRASIFIGVRGTGKTVLMAAIAEEAEKNGWISVNVTSDESMLEEILVQVREKAEHLLNKQAQARLSGIQVGSLGISIEHGQKKTTWRAELTAVIRELNEKGTGLLLTVDEVSPKHEALRVLVDAYQHFVRERRNVALLLAGLPQNISLLLRDDGISFLRRAFQHTLDTIEESEVFYAMRKTVEDAGRAVDSEALRIASESTGGYAFLIQLVGYHMWRQHENEHIISVQDAKDGVLLAGRDMERMIFSAVMKDLTPRERDFLMAMTPDEGKSELGDIAERMQIDGNNASQLKRRLVEHGVIEGFDRGQVAFAMPLLKEYLLKQ